jgi:hypothetical protein
MNVSSAIAVILSNVPAFLFVLALVIAVLGRGHGGPLSGLDPAAAHRPHRPLGCAAPSRVPDSGCILYRLAAEPFQFAVGMADLAMGVVSPIAFGASLACKGAAIWVASIYLLGDAIGYVRNWLMTANFAPGNGGPVFYMDIGLWIGARQEEAGYGVAPTRFA